MRLLSNSLLPRFEVKDDTKAPLVTSFGDRLAAADLITKPLHIVTPLVHSTVLSARTGHNIYLKLDAAQPAGSFKLRGIGRTCQAAYQVHGPRTHIIAASGGNAGLAAAESAKRLGVRCTVVVPRRTEKSVVERLRAMGAVVENGEAEVLDDADKIARELAARDPVGVYVHPFEDVSTALGHASIVPEIRDQLLGMGVEGGRPDVVMCSVGGGGLLRGIIHGIEELISEDPTFGSPKPKLIACQDFGANSFGKSWERWLRGEGEGVVTLDAITSQATSLGAKSCSAAALSAAIAYACPSGSTQDQELNLSTVVVEDPIAASACWQFDRDEALMVEISCGSALTPLYLNERILERVLPSGREGERLNVVVIVCGGSKVDREMLERYESEYGAADEGWRVRVDGCDV